MKIHRITYEPRPHCTIVDLKLENISVQDLLALRDAFDAEANRQIAEDRLRAQAKIIANRHCFKDQSAAAGCTGAASWVVDAIVEALKAGVDK